MKEQISASQILTIGAKKESAVEDERTNDNRPDFDVEFAIRNSFKEKARVKMFEKIKAEEAMESQKTASLTPQNLADSEEIDDWVKISDAAMGQIESAETLVGVMDVVVDDDQEEFEDDEDEWNFARMAKSRV
jgi:hypothetical protein